MSKVFKCNPFVLDFNSEIRNPWPRPNFIEISLESSIAEYQQQQRHSTNRTRAGRILQSKMQRACIMNLVSCLLLAYIITFLPVASYGEEILLSWDQTPEEELAGYNVYYGTTSGVYFEEPFKLPKESLVEADGRVSYQFPITLSPELTYYFAVTAYDIWGYETDFSNEGQFQLPEGGTNTSVIINNNDIVTYSRNVVLTHSAS